MRFLLPFIVLLAVLQPGPSQAAGSIADQVTAVKLYRGSSIIAASDPNHATYRANFTPEACRALLTERWQAEAATRTSGSIQYKCQIEERSSIQFQPAPSCPPPPPDQTRAGTCPTGTQGSWTQTGTTTYGPAPACTATVTWRPVTPPTGACQPIAPTQLPAPTGVTATTVSSSEIRVSWNVVPDAVAYSFRRCIHATCTTPTQLLCTSNLTQSHTSLGANITVRYQIVASRSADCTTGLGTPSVIVNGTTAGGTTPPPNPEPGPQTACVGQVCQVSWRHDGTPAAEGFRIVYGRSEGELTQVTQVASGAARSHQVTMPGTGVWYFGVKAFAGGNESDLSNVVVRTVQ